QESRILLIAAPVLEIDRLMRDVPVAAQDHFALRFAQLREMRQEDVEEAEFGGLSLRAARTRRQIHAHDRELAERCLEIAALRIELGMAEALREPRRRAAVHGDAAVALFVRGQVPAVCFARLARRT